MIQHLVGTDKASSLLFLILPPLLLLHPSQTAQDTLNIPLPHALSLSSRILLIAPSCLASAQLQAHKVISEGQQ